MSTNIGFLLKRYGIISSLRRVILLFGIFFGKFLLVPLIEWLFNKFGDYGNEEPFKVGSDFELCIVLILFYVMHRNLFGVPFTFKIYSIRTLLLLMESHYFLLSQMRAFDRFGLKCQHSGVDDLTPEQHKKNLIKIEKELILLETMKSKYDTPKSKDYIGYLTLKSYLETLKKSYSLHIYPTPQYFIYPMVYPVNQFVGCQMALIETLVKQQINSKSDAMDFIERIEYSDQYINGLLKDLKVRETEGIIPPKWIIDVSINQIEKKILCKYENSSNDYFLNKKLENDLQSLLKDNKKTIKSQKEIESILEELNIVVDKYLIPSYEKLKDYLLQLKPLSKDGDGLWRAPNGDELYDFLLKYHTNTTLTAKDIHEIGLKQVDSIKKEVIKLFKNDYPLISTDFSSTIRSISKEKQFQFSEGDKGRKEIIEHYESIIKDCSMKLDQYFERIPLANCSVERVPLFKEMESAPAYYTPPPMDKSKGGVFNVNLRNTNAHNRSMSKDLCYHEATPGHHFQISLAQEFKDIDAFRRVIVFSSYAEGWALYVEKLADECGWYENRFERLGYLMAEMWRSIRLVIDTGIHCSQYKWSREKSIQYMKDYTYLDESDITSEIDRYIVIPGQAVSYKIGQLKILELRDLAKSKLADKFQLKKFHSAILNNGSLPLDILEISVNNWINEQLQ
ncbi:hypothetical protein RB653_004649 [Dictyostelium firmibasis]|uniref:DUF885 domain-containing protein n=1 Tax=Dictyostelium firmibasis TaxID=79012 RepID=A0AAN7TZX6_9MYCE